MNRKTRDKWVKALRSGKYEQGRRALGKRTARNKKAQYCCLGVLAHLEGKKIGTTWNKGNLSVPDRESSALFQGLLPYSACQMLGLHQGVAGDLAGRNDEGATFAEIADLIEQKVVVS